MSVRSCVPSRCASIRQASTLSLVAESRTVPLLVRHRVLNKWEGKLEGIVYCMSFPGSTCSQTVRSTRSSCTHQAKCTAKTDIEGYRSFPLAHLPPSAAPFLPCAVLSCNFFCVLLSQVKRGCRPLVFSHSLSFLPSRLSVSIHPSHNPSFSPDYTSSPQSLSFFQRARASTSSTFILPAVLPSFDHRTRAFRQTPFRPTLFACYALRPLPLHTARLEQRRSSACVSTRALVPSWP